MATGPASSSPNALIHEPLLHYLSPIEDRDGGNLEDSEQGKRDPITDENLDEWIMGSVQEVC
jgi:hypothetical protein